MDISSFGDLDLRVLVRTANNTTASKIIPVLHIHNKQTNFKFLGRFSVALNIDTEFTLMIDDDMVTNKDTFYWLHLQHLHIIFSMPIV